MLPAFPRVLAHGALVSYVNFLFVANGQSRRRLKLMAPEFSMGETGMDLRDLLADAAFRGRPKRPRDPSRSETAFKQLSKLLATDEKSVLQELVDGAVRFCGADSAGISLEEPETGTFRWVAVAGSFAPYLGGRTPRNFSPCGTCLDAARPQLYRVSEPYYDFLGVTAKPIIDGILIPWSNEHLKGTIWAVSHSSFEAFDADDYEFLKSLSDFASVILRQQAHQRLLTAAETARASADTRLKRLMETEAVGMIIFDCEGGTVVDANDEFLRMVGYTRPELESGALSWRKLTPPDWIATSEEQMRRFRETGRIGPYEKQYFRKDGSRRWMLFAGRDLGDGTLGEFAIDISDRKRAEAALVRNEKLASLGRLAASIAHEINNPLEATTNLLYLANNSGGLSAEAKEYLTLAEAELKRVAHITRQSLGFYRESDKPEEISVPELLESSIDLLRGKIAAKGAQIRRRWDGKLNICAVPGEVRQVFSNLLTNGLDAIDPGGFITVRAGRFSSSQGPIVRVSFADSGCGIDLSNRGSIFDPFFSTKGDHGNGLGLWVTAQIVEKHKGWIRMKSRTTSPQRGTIFSVAFPA
jgi:PAS domain S-box-containing protein